MITATSGSDYIYESVYKDNNIYFRFDIGTRRKDSNKELQNFHPHFEIYILLSGECTHVIEGLSYPVDTHDLALFKPNILHKTIYTSESPSKRLVISYSNELLKDVFGAKFSVINNLFEQKIPIYRFNKNNVNKLINIYNDFLLTSRLNNQLKDTKVFTLMIDFLYELYNISTKNLYQIELGESSIEHKISNIVSYIHDNYSKSITLEQLSKDFYISPHYLSHQFKNVMGFNLIDYIQLTRVNKAQELLLCSNDKIITISEKCGFGSLSQFNRVFNKHTHITPSQYRKNSGTSST